MNRDLPERFQDLLEAYADDRASAEELRELEKMLAGSSACRKALVERTMMDVYIRKTLHVLPAQENATRARLWRNSWVGASAIAALLLMSLALLWRKQTERHDTAIAPPVLPAPPTPKREVAVERDPATWPFSSTSPWNCPIGSEAQYAPIVGPAAEASIPLTVNSAEVGTRVYTAQPENPPTKIFIGKERTPLGEFRIPADATPGTSGYACLLLIDERHEFAYELIAARRLNGEFVCAKAIKENLRGSGVDTIAEFNGMRSFGGTSLGGMLRKNELHARIRHTLGLAVPAAMLSVADSKRSSVWPASAAARKIDFGTGSNLHLGSLVALPPDVDIEKLGLTGAALELARAFQNYGAYVVSHVGTPDRSIAIFTETGAEAGADSNLKEQLAHFARQLKVVTNNSPQSIGGGGKPRVEPAPEFHANETGRGDF